MFLKIISSKRTEHFSLRQFAARSQLGQTLRSLRQLGLALIIVLSILSINPDVATAAVPPNFEDTFVTSVSGPTDLTWTPDGRMLIIGKGGQLRVYTNGALLPTPALDIASRLCTVGEQGLVGIVVHPNFATNRYIYLYYTYNKFNNSCPESQVDGPVDRFSRFTLPDTNIIDLASEVVLFETAPRYRNHHTGGDPKFGKDGYIYITVGDAGGQSLGWPQDLGRLAGKVLRITDTGGIPADNPYLGSGTARCNVGGIPPAGSPTGTKCQEIYTAGLRNPFRQAMDPNAAGVRFYINDVGQHSWEEISEGPVAGGNYGWPVREGPCVKDSDTDCGPPPAGMTDPVHWYHHGVNGGAATAGAFVPNGVWPAPYNGTYLFADYVFGAIYQLVPNGAGCRLCSPPTSSFNQVEFAPITEVVSMRFGPYGTGQALYYVTRNQSQIRRIAYTGELNRSPVANATANPTFGALPLSVQFNGGGSSDPDNDPLTYEWDFQNDGTPDSTALSPTHLYTSAGVYFAKLTVRDGKGGVNSTTVRIDAGNTPPMPVIETPTASTLFASDQHFTLHGSATDAQDGTLSNSSLSWQVILHHSTHTHPFLEPTTGNDIEIIAPQPEDLDAASTSYLEILLTATDSNGLTRTISQELRPRYVDVTFQTNPAGLYLTVGGSTFTGPTTISSWQGARLSINAPNQTDSSGNVWAFNSWSDGGPASHTITTPATTSTYTATFATSQFLAFAPSDDAYIDAGAPTSNFGSNPRLMVDNSPVRHTLLKFNIAGVGSQTVAGAKLRLYGLDGSSSGGNFYRVSNNAWSEGSVTWNNAPAADATSFASLGTVAAGTWYEVDVTSLITGDGPVSLRMSSLSSNGADYSSSEGAAGFAPQLIVMLGGASGSTSTPTATSTHPSTPATATHTATSTPTATPSHTPTNTPTATPSHTPTNTSTATQTPIPGGAPVTFLPVADAYVRDSSPTSNYGNATSLRADASPIDRSYLRFNVQGLGGPVTRATLRVFATSASSQGYQTRSVSDNSWGELTINFNNSPAVGSVLGSSGPISANTWTSIDVTSYITGNGSFNLALTTNSSTAMSFSSRQGSNPPQLVIETQNGPAVTTTFTPTFTSTASMTPISNCNAVYHGPLMFNGGMSMNIANQTGIPLAVQDLFVIWNHDTGHLLGADKTLRLQQASLNGVSFWTGNVTGPSSTIPPSNLLIPTGESTILFTFHQTYEMAEGSEQIFINLKTNGCESHPIDSSSPAVTHTPTLTATVTRTPTATATRTPTNPASTGTFTFIPIADSYVNETSPTTNYGSLNSLRTDGSPILRSYLRFNVQGLSGNVSRATLRVFANTASSAGCSASSVSNNTWTESTINYNNAPPVGGALGSSGSFGAGVWINIDVTAYITGNGTFNMALTPLGTTAISFASRESGANAPQLVVETSP